MVTIKDFIEEWIEMRSVLQKQLKAIESGQLHGELAEGGTEQTKVRIKKLGEELNTLLKEHATARGS